MEKQLKTLAYPTKLDKLFKLQKKVLRIKTFSPYIFSAISSALYQVKSSKH